MEIIGRVLARLLSEMVNGPAENGALMLNRGDRGLLASLAALSAATASARPGGRSSVAAHVDHVRYGLELLNRWAQGEDPWATANYAASWERQQVNDEQWQELRGAIADELKAWMRAIQQPRDWNENCAAEALASVAHLAYHFGAIRQLAQAASGPRAAD